MIVVNESVKRLLINEIPHSIINYAVYIKWLSSKDTDCILDLDYRYADINSLEDVQIDSEYAEWYSEEEIEKAKLCLYKLVNLTRNKIITTEHYEKHGHHGTSSECERLFSVYHDELKEILEIIKS